MPPHFSRGRLDFHDDMEELDDVLMEDGFTSEPEDSVSTRDNIDQALTPSLNPWFGAQPHKLFYGLGSILSIQPDDGEWAEMCAYAAVPQFVQYCIWRRWLMALLIPIVLADFIWSLYSNVVVLDHVVSTSALTSVLVTPVFKSYTIFKDITEISVIFVQLCFLCVSFYWSHQWRRSRNWLTISFVLPYAFVFIQFLLPIRSMLGSNFIHVATDIVATQIDNWFEQKINASASAFPSGQAHIYMQMAEKVVDEFRGSILQDLLENFFYFYLNIQILIGYLKSTGPASLCLLPAVARGAILVKKLFPQSAEMGWLTRIVPVLFTPLLGFVLLLLVQFSASFLVTGASISLIMALLLPSFFLMLRLLHRSDSPKYFASELSIVSAVRIVLATVFITLMIIYVATTEEAQSFIKNHMTSEGLARFILEFLIKYNLLTILSADWLIEGIVHLFNPTIIESSITISTLTESLSHLRNPVITLQALAEARVQGFQSGSGSCAILCGRWKKERTTKTSTTGRTTTKKAQDSFLGAAESQAAVYDSLEERNLGDTDSLHRSGPYGRSGVGDADGRREPFYNSSNSIAHMSGSTGSTYVTQAGQDRLRAQDKLKLYAVDEDVDKTPVLAAQGLLSGKIGLNVRLKIKGKDNDGLTLGDESSIMETTGYGSL